MQKFVLILGVGSFLLNLCFCSWVKLCNGSPTGNFQIWGEIAECGCKIVSILVDECVLELPYSYVSTEHYKFTTAWTHTGRCHRQFRQFLHRLLENLEKCSKVAKFCQLRRKWKLQTLRDVEDSSISDFCHFDDNFGPLISLANIHDRMATNTNSRHSYHESRNSRTKIVRYFRHEMAKVI